VAWPLPEPFIERNRAAPAWLDGLPALVARLADLWSLHVEAAAWLPTLILNFVAPATRADGTRCVLKVSRHLDDTRTEIVALRLWAGRGAARVLEAEPALGALLLERLEPGTNLVSLAAADDDAATRIAAASLRQLWQVAPVEHQLHPLASWCAAYDRTRAALEAGRDGFPAALFRRADALRADLLASTPVAYVLHGDLHHYNLLRAQRADWLAIDPKGLAGDRCFDVCQFFRNPLPWRPLAVATNRRRLDIFADELGLDRGRIKSWALVHAVLDACWDVEDGTSWRAAVAYAEDTLRL